MIEMLQTLKKYGSVSLIIVSLMAIFLSGIFFSVIYLTMERTESGFQATDCVIEGNLYVSTCQELWALSLYPLLALRELLIWASYFFIFAFVFGMLVAGYQSGKSPVLLGVLVLFVIAITYGSIELANIYRTMLEIPAFLSMVQPFTIYNKLMLNFPWFTFIIGLFSAMLGVVNYQKARVNKVEDSLNY